MILASTLVLLQIKVVMESKICEKEMNLPHLAA